MILLLNYLPWLILFIGGVLFGHFLKTKKTKNAIIVFVITFFMYFSIIKMTPTYMPKGTVQGLPEVHLQEPKGEIKDNLLSAKSNEHRNKEFKEAFDAKEKVKNVLEK